MSAVRTMTRYTSECYDCGYVSAAYMNTGEADEDGRMHRCPDPTKCAGCGGMGHVDYNTCIRCHGTGRTAEKPRDGKTTDLIPPTSSPST